MNLSVADGGDEMRQRKKRKKEGKKKKRNGKKKVAVGTTLARKFIGDARRSCLHALFREVLFSLEIKDIIYCFECIVKFFSFVR